MAYNNGGMPDQQFLWDVFQRQASDMKRLELGNTELLSEWTKTEAVIYLRMSYKWPFRMVPGLHLIPKRSV